MENLHDTIGSNLMNNMNLKKFRQFIKCLDFLTIFQQILFRICTSHDDEVFKRNCVVVLEMLHDQLISSNNFIACEKDFHFLLEEWPKKFRINQYFFVNMKIARIIICSFFFENTIFLFVFGLTNYIFDFQMSFKKRRI